MHPVIACHMRLAYRRTYICIICKVIHLWLNSTEKEEISRP